MKTAKDSCVRSMVWLAAALLSTAAAYGQFLGPPPELKASDPTIETRARGPEGGLAAINTRDRDTAVAAYNSRYVPSNGVASGWTGNVGTCTAGDTSSAWKDAVRLRVNYYRSMVGLPEIDFDATNSSKCQEAALMMAANGDLNHYPPPTWTCYTDAGHEAAGKSNLSLGYGGAGYAGAVAVTGQMQDDGAGNYFCGHRRWILFPPQMTMGTGDVTPPYPNWQANALWVVGPTFGSRPAAPEWISWPPPGFVPRDLVFTRWSFSYSQQATGANSDPNFTAATVAITKNGVGIAPNIQPVFPAWPSSTYYGDNTLVWEPATGLSAEAAGDDWFHVTIGNVFVNETPRSFSYYVVATDPATASTQGAPTLDQVTDNGDGTLHMTWLNGNSTPMQFLGFNYDIYTGNWANRGAGGTIWYPFATNAGQGDMNLALSGGYFSWISNQYPDLNWYYCANPWVGIMYSGIPHTPTGVTATQTATSTVGLSWDPDIYGTCMYQIAARRQSDGVWVNMTGLDGTGVWHTVVYPSAQFMNGGAGFTVPSGGTYTFFIAGMGWLPPYPVGGYGVAVVTVI